MAKVSHIRNRFLDGLKEIKPELIVNTPLENAISNTLNITFPGVNNAEFMAVMDLHGICVSAGSACSRKEIDYALRIIKEYAEGRMLTVNILKATHVNRDFLKNDGNFILDIRFNYERALLKGLPNSHEVSILSFKKYIHQFPKDKNILVVCMGGANATAFAYLLRDKGYKNISLLMGGVIAWRIAQPDLYSEMAGSNIIRLLPE